MTTPPPPPDGGARDCSGDCPDDWMTGVPRLAFQRCGGCGAVWYFHRPLCPSCGAADPASLVADGAGTVAAVTVVRRAPTPELRALAPYRVVLVDLAEGVRVMAHAPMTDAEGGAKAVAIGDPVRIVFHDFGGRPMPLAIPARPGVLP